MAKAHNRWLRILRHRWADETDIARALDAAALQRLEQAVTDSERHHSGEIRLCIEAGLPMGYLWQRATARERAITLFGKLGVWDTEHNNGVLIYLLLAEHAIEIVADRGLTARVPPAQWQALVAALGDAFCQRRYEQGLMQAIAAVDGLLRAHFPLTAGLDNPNELPDRVEWR